MNCVERKNDNVDENPDEFNQLNENIKEAYKLLNGTFPKVKKVRAKYNSSSVKKLVN
jgi:hypothetical protein